MVDIPVLGLGETSMLTACMMGSTFSLVGVNPYFGGRFEENVAKYGLRERLASIECMGLTPHELDACFSDPDGGGRRIESFQRGRPRASLEKGAEVVIPAGGRLTAFLNADGIREVDGAPAAGRHGLAASLPPRRRSASAGSPGAFVSRRRLYARAPEASIAAAGAEYADGYHLPALGRLGRRIHQRRRRTDSHDFDYPLSKQDVVRVEPRPAAGDGARRRHGLPWRSASRPTLPARSTPSSASSRCWPASRRPGTRVGSACTAPAHGEAGATVGGDRAVGASCCWAPASGWSPSSRRWPGLTTSSD